MVSVKSALFFAVAASAAVVKRELGPLTSLTSHVYLYYEQDLCERWAAQCSIYTTKRHKQIESVCQPRRHDGAIVTVIDAGCFLTTDSGPQSVTEKVIKDHPWQAPAEGLLVPHAAKLAADHAERWPGLVLDKQEKWEYHQYYTILKEEEASRTAEEIERSFQHYKAMLEEKAKKSNHERPIKPWKQYKKLSELERQNLLNYAESVESQVQPPLYPFPATAFKRIQYMKYREEAFQKYGIRIATNAIENMEEFIKKKSEGMVLKFPA